MAGVYQVEPELGFHQEAKLGAEVQQESMDSKGIVVREINAQCTVAVKLFTGGATGRRGMGEQDLVKRIIYMQPGYEVLCSACLANRDGMQPYDRFFDAYGIKAKALANVVQIFRLFPRPPEQANNDERQQQP